MFKEKERHIALHGNADKKVRQKSCCQKWIYDHNLLYISNWVNLWPWLLRL